jgi:hypothetical protein
VSDSFIFDGVVHVDERELAGRKPLNRFWILGDDVPLFSSFDSPLRRLEIKFKKKHFFIYKNLFLTIHLMVDQHYYYYYPFVSEGKNFIQNRINFKKKFTVEWLTRKVNRSITKLFIFSTAFVQLSASA